MNTTKYHKQLDGAHRATLARRARDADTARVARTLLQAEVRARLDQERAMLAFARTRVAIAS